MARLTLFPPIFSFFVRKDAYDKEDRQLSEHPSSTNLCILIFSEVQTKEVPSGVFITIIPREEFFPIYSKQLQFNDRKITWRPKDMHWCMIKSHPRTKFSSMTTANKRWKNISKGPSHTQFNKSTANDIFSLNVQVCIIFCNELEKGWVSTSVYVGKKSI